MSMKIGERGQVTIPKEIREAFGLQADTEVEFRVVKGAVLLRKTPKKLDLQKWKGRCAQSFVELGYASTQGASKSRIRRGAVDRFVEDVRGR